MCEPVPFIVTITVILKAIKIGSIFGKIFYSILRNMSSQKILNPFKILGLSPGASQLEVKRAYQKRLRQYHPDKGGNPAHTDLINRAYKQILYDYFQAGPSSNNTQNTNYNPNEFQVPEIMNRHGFEINNFNNKFEDHRNLDHNVYQVDPSQYIERDRATYQMERGQVEQEIGQIKPIIDPRQNFNSNTFNQAFQQHSQATQIHGGIPTQIHGGIQSDQSAMMLYQEPLASVSALSPATSGNGMVQYTELGGGDSQGLSNLNFSGVDDGYQVNSLSTQALNDPRFQGNTKTRYQNLLQERTRMDFQKPIRDGSAVNFQASDWNAQMTPSLQLNPSLQMTSQIPGLQMTSQMTSAGQLSDLNYQPNTNESNTYESNTYESGVYSSTPHQQQNLPSDPVQSQSLILNNQNQMHLQQLQQVYLQAQVHLMDNLSQLLKQQAQIKNKPSWISQKPVQIVQSDSGQVTKLEKEIQTLKKTLAVQDKLLKSISMAQSPI